MSFISLLDQKTLSKLNHWILNEEIIINRGWGGRRRYKFCPERYNTQTRPWVYVEEGCGCRCFPILDESKLRETYNIL